MSVVRTGSRPIRRVSWLGAAMIVAAMSLSNRTTVGAQATHGSGKAAKPRATAQTVAPDASQFVLTTGNDTIAVEDVQRDTNDVSAAFDTRGRGRYMLDARIDARNLVSRLELTAYPPIGNTATVHAIVAIVDDSVFAQVGPSLQRAATQIGALPWINPSFALLEIVVQRARRVGKDTVTIPLFFVEGGTTTPATITRHGKDSTIVDVNGVELRLRTSADGRLLGGVIPSAHEMITRTSIPFSAKGLAFAAPSYTAPANAPYSSEEVKIQSPAGVTLAGTLTIPKRHAARAPAVVLITGAGLEDRDESMPGVNGYRPFRQIADTLGRTGLILLRMDERGYGASGASASPPTIADLATDSRAAIAYLRSRPDVDASHVFLLGHSEGGEIAPMIAASDSTIAGIVTLGAPAVTGRQIRHAQLEYALAQDTTITEATRDSVLRSRDAILDSAAIAQPWVRYYVSYDPLPTARQVRVPALILQGGSDHQVSADQAAMLGDAMKAGGNRDVTVHVFPGVDHLFLVDPAGNPGRYATLPSTAVGSDVLGTIADWITAHSK